MLTRFSQSYAHDATKRRQRNSKSIAEARGLAIAQVPGPQVRFGEVFWQQSVARQDRRPAECVRLDVQHVDLEDRARLGALYEHRSGQRVPAELVRRNICGCRVEPEMEVGGVACL